MIFDTHCHLNSDELYPNINDHILDAQKVGVRRFLVVGWDEKSSLLAIKIAEQFDCCYAAIGFHPTEIFNLKENTVEDFFKKYATHPKVVAIGEIGLDYHWIKEEDKRNLQKEYFKKQIRLANFYNLPICIHNRDAINDCLEILKECPPQYKGIMHCYSGSSEMLNDFMNLGLYISLGGPVTFTNAKTPKEVAEEVPLNKLLIETDCPYLSPHPLRGTINVPKNIALVLDMISSLRSEGKKHIEDILYKNACELFHV